MLCAHDDRTKRPGWPGESVVFLLTHCQLGTFFRKMLNDRGKRLEIHGYIFQNGNYLNYTLIDNAATRIRNVFKFFAVFSHDGTTTHYSLLNKHVTE